AGAGGARPGGGLAPADRVRDGVGRPDLQRRALDAGAGPPGRRHAGAVRGGPGFRAGRLGGPAGGRPGGAGHRLLRPPNPADAAGPAGPGGAAGLARTTGGPRPADVPGRRVGVLLPARPATGRHAGTARRPAPPGGRRGGPRVGGGQRLLTPARGRQPPAERVALVLGKSPGEPSMSAARTVPLLIFHPLA